MSENSRRRHCFDRFLHVSRPYPGYRIDSYGQSVSGKPEQLCQNHRVCVGLLRRIGTQERAARGSRQDFSPLRVSECTQTLVTFPASYRESYGAQDGYSPALQVAERDLRLSEKVSWGYRDLHATLPQG